MLDGKEMTDTRRKQWTIISVRFYDIPRYESGNSLIGSTGKNN
ncbi:hypothetical protein [Paenibacillus kribbensis]|nr:hypothetical protein [Paenibacillus kribbensis]